jgi:hypothetical protein
MQDIPRNELLDKLAAGWKVRRSVWPKEQTISKNGGSITVAYTELIEDDWEGAPIKPTLTLLSVSAPVAFNHLVYHGANYIRRTAWKEGKVIRPGGDNVTLAINDILAIDWEIWTWTKTT